ncbi:type II toxin-antitoxin system HicB family antitoxin [Candidatus Berkelbacteria bacterium]|nr:type II toxin-antitoxin system HicB family antitoxin [Candidatus Berkelbacteria bacterium]
MMKQTFTSIIKKDGAWFVAECVETGVVSQGRTVQSAKKNLREAMSLYLEELSPRERKTLARFRSFVAPLEMEYV